MLHVRLMSPEMFVSAIEPIHHTGRRRRNRPHKAAVVESRFFMWIVLAADWQVRIKGKEINNET